MKSENDVQKLAIYSRIFIVIIQYFSNSLIPDHDADAFAYPKADTNSTVVDKIILHLLGGFVRWDAQYFMHIANYGYTYENTLAFFPLYPVTVRLISIVIFAVVPLVSLDSILLLIFVGLNIVLFVLATKLLFNLTTIVFDKAVAYKTTILFCFNPASIFFIAPYTECMFAYLTFQSILNCITLYKKYSSSYYKVHFIDIAYLLPIALSTIVRSNGILNIGFVAYTCLCIFFKTSFTLQRFLKCIFIILFVTIVCLIPFIVFQIYCYQRFCTNFEANLAQNVISHAEKNNFVLPGQFSKYNQSWCYGGLAYSYVQAHYWNVGFLKYYRWKQIPNFLLAAPILYILIKHCCQHIKFNLSRNIADMFSFNKLFKKEITLNDGLFRCTLNVFVIHGFILTIFCCLFVHIQVATRMLCAATPLFYWVCASYLHSTKISSANDIITCDKSFKDSAIKIYFGSYFVIGTILFSNSLPWT